MARWRSAALILSALIPSLGKSTPVSERTLAHYSVRGWSEESDAPHPVYDIAQDKRGYIWLATAQGVFRFDGLRFEPMSSRIDIDVHGPPTALLTRKNGEIWTNFARSGKFALFRDSQLLIQNTAIAPHRVATMREAEDGTIWVLTESMSIPLMRFKNGQWTSFGNAENASPDNPFSMVLVRDGTVWISHANSVSRLALGMDRLEVVRKTPGARGRLSIDPQGRIWISEQSGSYPLTGPYGSGAPPPLRYAYATDKAQIRGQPFFDREGNLWIATYYNGVQRVMLPDPRGATSAAQAVLGVEQFTSQASLTTNATRKIFQDSRRNIWVATENGIARFHPSALRKEQALDTPAAFGDLLLAASDGVVYIAQASTVYRVALKGQPKAIFRTAIEPRTLCEAPDGAIWIGLTDKSVVLWRDGKIHRIADPAPLRYTIYDCAFDADGNYWISAGRGGLARFRAGQWEDMSVPVADEIMAKSMVTDGGGKLIIQTGRNTITQIDGDQRETLSLPFILHAEDDLALAKGADGDIYIGYHFGLARMRQGKLDVIDGHRASAIRNMKGFAQSPDGYSWIVGPSGVVRVATNSLNRAFAELRESLVVQNFGPSVGSRSRPHSHSRNAIVRGGDGRLWIATQSGTVSFDPALTEGAQPTPQVAIGAVVANRVYRDPAKVDLPAGTSDLQIDFAVLDFVDPREARARYRLLGQDHKWIEAGERRQAFYTNLGPGNYRFEIVAANDNGVWSTEGASVELTINPTFFQSWAFFAICAFATIGLAWLFYHLRVVQIASRIRARYEERLNERERIARELHDTLLQSVQGLILHFQSVANAMSTGSLLAAKVEAALARADLVVEEGRRRVHNLREVQVSIDLPELLAKMVADAQLEPPIEVRIRIEGEKRVVKPQVAVELGRIAEEALFNIHRHAHAQNCEIVVQYAQRRLTVVIRDDGIGIAEEIINLSRGSGHFGLIGMRERASKLGGNLMIDGQPNHGTAVIIQLKAQLAYADGRTISFERLRQLVKRMDGWLRG